MPEQMVRWGRQMLLVEFEVMKGEADVSIPWDYPEIMSIKDAVTGKEIPSITAQQEDEIILLINMPEDD